MYWPNVFLQSLEVTCVMLYYTDSLSHWQQCTSTASACPSSCVWLLCYL